VPEPGRPATTANYEVRPITGRLVEDELAAALSEHLERPVRLLARDPGDRGAVLRVTEPVPRCAVTTRDPDSGRRVYPTLKAIAELRGKRDVTFGVWCEVVASGPVRVGDVVTPSG
jgi:uncharacterized protein YcbX